MKKKLIKINTIIMLCLSMIIMWGCSSKEDNIDKGNSKEKITIKISGSTSVGPIIEKEAAAYTGENKDIRIEVQEIGSSSGIKNSISGVSNLGMSSRELKAEEKSQLKTVEIAYDGVAIIVHPTNTVTNLTSEEIRKIYCGEITNWKEIGGEDKEIVIVSREDGSGTRDGFQQIVGFTSEEISPKAIISDGNGNIKTTVASNPNTIGYMSFEHIDEAVKAIAVDEVMPSGENVLNKSYKLWRPFLLVYKDEYLTSSGQKFIDYILSSKGQKIVEENGGIKVKH